MTVIVDLTPAARRLSELVRRIDDDQLGAPTPSGIPVADMLDHIGGLAVAFTAAAAKDLGSVTVTRPAPDGDRLGTAWRAEIPVPHGHHHYLLIVDGKPTLDPRGHGIARNESGEKVSLLAVS